MFLTPADGSRIARELKATIGRDVNIMDRTGVIIASTDPRRIGRLHAAARQVIEQRLPVLEVTQADESAGIQEGVNLPIDVDGSCEGVIGITGPAASVRDFGTIAKKMAEILLASMVRQEQRTMLQQAQDLFIETWLFAREPDWQAMALRGSLLEIDTELPRRVAVLEYAADGAQDAPELRSSQLLQMIAPHLGDDRQTLRTVVNRRILLLFGGSGLARAPAILSALRRDAAGRWGLRLSGGLSTVSHGAEDLRRCYSEARLAARAASRDGSIREYGSSPLDLVLQSLEPAVKRDLLHAVFPPLPDADAEELLQCLRLYFRCDGHVEQAAAQACIHKNTFRYRMDKLHRVTGYDLRSPRDAALLYLALQILEDRPPENLRKRLDNPTGEQ